MEDPLTTLSLKPFLRSSPTLLPGAPSIHEDVALVIEGLLRVVGPEGRCRVVVRGDEGDEIAALGGLIHANDRDTRGLGLLEHGERRPFESRGTDENYVHLLHDSGPR